jgi:L-seryl-tRNA(Ser) seleniumtransferase
MRLDKAVLLALEATLLEYVTGRLDAIPTLAMLRRSPVELRAAAESLATLLIPALPEWEVQPIEIESRVGGGAAPEVALPSWGLAVVNPDISADELTRRLRRTSPAMVGRVVDDRLVLDMRTLLDGDDDRVLAALAQSVL